VYADIAEAAAARRDSQAIDLCPRLDEPLLPFRQTALPALDWVDRKHRGVLLIDGVNVRSVMLRQFRRTSG
jgi:hypothetical protein